MQRQKKILVTGATGRVGRSVIRYLQHQPVRVFAGVRDPDRAAGSLAGAEPVPFDFLRPGSYGSYLGQMDALFLIRPPQLTQMSHFRPLIERAVSYQLRFVVFLSVQGADTSRFIPHARIEKMIREAGLAACFLRPSWFMQNFEGPLWKDLVERGEIFLPAGKARFLPIHVDDIGAVASQVLVRMDPFVGQALDLTGTEKLSFGDMAEILSEELGDRIRYRSARLLSFLGRKKREGQSLDYAFVQWLLHALPKLTREPELSDEVMSITGRPPRDFRSYARSLKELWPE